MLLFTLKNSKSILLFLNLMYYYYVFHKRLFINPISTIIAYRFTLIERLNLKTLLEACCSQIFDFFFVFAVFTVVAFAMTVRIAITLFLFALNLSFRIIDLVSLFILDRVHSHASAPGEPSAACLDCSTRQSSMSDRCFDVG